MNKKELQKNTIIWHDEEILISNVKEFKRTTLYNVIDIDANNTYHAYVDMDDEDDVIGLVPDTNQPKDTKLSLEPLGANQQLELRAIIKVWDVMDEIEETNETNIKFKKLLNNHLLDLIAGVERDDLNDMRDHMESIRKSITNGTLDRCHPIVETNFKLAFMLHIDELPDCELDD